MMVERRELHPPVATVIAFTVSFSGVNVSLAVDMNATLPPAVEARVMRAAMGGVDQLVDVQVRRGGAGMFYYCCSKVYTFSAQNSNAQNESSKTPTRRVEFWN